MTWFSKKKKADDPWKEMGFHYHYIGRFGDCFVCNVCSAFVQDYTQHRKFCKLPEGR